MNKFHQTADFCYCIGTYQSVNSSDTGGRYGAWKPIPAIFTSFPLQVRRFVSTFPVPQYPIRQASSDMTVSGLDRLNDGQRDCLRLVLAHLNSKEIARELGVSPHTVDQRLRIAMRILGAQSRFEAARIFARLDQENSYQPLIYQSSAVEAASKTGEQDASSGRIRTKKTGRLDDGVNADGGGAILGFEQSEIRHRPLPIPRYRGEKNSLAAVERLGWILAIAIGAALSFGGLIAGLEALSRLKG
ncbi:helix-turn-helix transcriptional regulator [Sphingorhabdus sp. M41]|uniref:helix-turn-helix transcriptional regulator n=1 Tax=Sphingorhabdus sp. M41 TaxID=1806885 RepID=UPI0018D30A82|nr:helix-turn-helix transcriptional regulator [Sphingorhabdus sp. M41]